MTKIANAPFLSCPSLPWRASVQTRGLEHQDREDRQAKEPSCSVLRVLCVLLFKPGNLNTKIAKIAKQTNCSCLAFASLASFCSNPGTRTPRSRSKGTFLFCPSRSLRASVQTRELEHQDREDREANRLFPSVLRFLGVLLFKPEDLNTKIAKIAKQRNPSCLSFASLASFCSNPGT